MKWVGQHHNPRALAAGRTLAVVHWDWHTRQEEEVLTVVEGATDPVEHHQPDGSSDSEKESKNKIVLFRIMCYISYNARNT